jgi:membrane protease YdiL (CAAX protease family)
MIPDPVVSNSIKVARQSRRATLAFLAAGFIFFVILILGLGLVIQSEYLGDSIKIMALITVTLGVLIFGMAIIGDLTIRKYSWKWDSPGMILVWAYLVPGIYFLCLCLGFTIYTQDVINTLTHSVWMLINRLPVLWLWQTVMLTWFLIRVKNLVPMSTFPMKAENAITGGLSGLGLGLVATLTFSILSNFIPTILPYGSTGWEGQAAIFWIVIILALTLFPWVEEQFFRGILPDSLAPGIGSKAAVWLSAALFALLVFRWIYFLPFFIVGLGFAMLKEKRGLSSAVIAHAVCNLVILGLFSGLLT